MEVQHMLSPHNSSARSYAYYVKDHLTALPKIAYNHAWSDWLQRTPPLPPPPLSEEADAAFEMQMQHLRFPTPPITPPRGIGSCHGLGINSSGFTAAATVSKTPPHTRTQSVIMKVGPGGQSPRYHVPTPQPALEMTNLPLSSLEAASRSESSSPSSDYICEWLDCGRYFNSLESLAAHVTQIHAVASLADGLYYCRWTGCARTERGFNARYKMLVHVRTHTKEKPHQCHLCEKSFSRAENLKIHIRSHSGEKPYVCTYEGCHKAYSNSSDRFKHTRTHCMEKPYMCKVAGCHKRYTDPSSLRKHVKTFKHAMQMLSSAPIYVPALASVTSMQQHRDNFSGPSPNSSPSESTVHTRPYPSREALPPSATYYCLPSAHNGAYYLDLGPEEMCHIKASQLELECYYAATKSATNVANYWYDSESGAPRTVSALPLHKDDFAMEMDLDVDIDGNGGEVRYEVDAVAGETPLDLRMKRS